MLIGRTFRIAIVVVAIGVAAALAWWLFGSKRLISLHAEGRAYRSWGRLTQYDWDRNRDGRPDFRFGVPWAYANRNDLVCFPYTSSEDRNFDGQWDFWVESDSDDWCLRVVRVDDDFDGIIDWSATADFPDFSRIVAGTRTPIVIGVARIYDLRSSDPCSKVRFSSPEVYEVACWAERHGLSPDQTSRFWRRAVQLEFREGHQREIAEKTAAGLLAEFHADWPPHVLAVYRRALDRGADDPTATEEAASYFFEFTWGPGTGFRKNYSPPPEPAKNPQHFETVVVPPDPNDD